MASWFSWARDLGSPCLPFCYRIVSLIPHPQSTSVIYAPPTWRTSGPFDHGAQQQHEDPPGGSGGQPGQRRPGSGCSWISSVSLLWSATEKSHHERRPCGILAEGKTGHIRQTSGFPERHLEGRIESVEGKEVKSGRFNRSSEAVDVKPLGRFGASGRVIM